MARPGGASEERARSYAATRRLARAALDVVLSGVQALNNEMDDPRQYPPPPKMVHEPISGRRFLFRLVFTVVSVIFWGGIVMPIVWEILGKGHPSEDGSNFGALGLPDWTVYVVWASCVAWWGMALWAAEQHERAESSASTAASAHTPTDAPSTGEPPGLH